MNEDRFFILNRGEMQHRWDALFNIFHLRYENKFSFPAKRLGSLISKPPQYGANEQGLERTSKDQIRYIRITDINSDGELTSDLGAIAENNDKRFLLSKGDILFARSGNTVGKTFIFDPESHPTSIFAGYLIRFVLDESQVLPDYIFYLTQFSYYKDWVRAIQRPSGQPNINAQEYRSLELPVPPKSVQKKIVEQMQKAYKEKNEKENQAEELLASIDDYLLNELGINLPPEPENTIENRKFRTSYTKVFGDRLDPYFNQDYFYQIKEAIKDADYPSVFIKDTMQGLMIKGYLPKQEEKDGDNKVVQINSINRDGTINLDDLLTAQDVFSSFHKLKQDDILVVITGATIGKIGYWNYEGDYFLGGDIVKFQTAPNQFDPFYVYAYLRSKPSQVEIKRNITGATNGHLAPEDVKHILIPKPPIEKQREIAEVIRVKTHQAYELQSQALSEFQQAKKEIEQLILNPAQ